jgi:predicted flap endonuclease-1-like 5' DNA nuclease
MNKNENVVIAVFKDYVAAEQAIVALRHWDKADREIKLGAVGTVSKADGKVETRVGRRVGRGAGVGAILGVIAGVLSGGVTVVGGAVAGTVLGAIVGSLSKRSLHLTEKEIEELGRELDAGKVAVVVNCDDYEIEGTRAHLSEAGGSVQTYEVPGTAIAEAVEALEKTPVDEIAADIPEPATPEEMAKFSRSLEYVEGIGPIYAERLGQIGILTPWDLLQRGATRTGRAHIAQATEISDQWILNWVNQVDLYRIKGVGQEYADLLERAGVDTVLELAQRNPQNLHGRLIEINAEKRLVRQVPSENQIQSWVEQAKGLPRMVTY